jgi:hypothetical protein
MVLSQIDSFEQFMNRFTKLIASKPLRRNAAFFNRDNFDRMANTIEASVQR